MRTVLTSLFCLILLGLTGCSGSFPTDKPIVEGFIDVTGGKVYYRIVGADKPGIPLLALHGGPGAAHDYLEPLEALADERPVIFYDQLGCGSSDRPGDTTLWTLERFVDELATIRKELGLKKVHIMGQSWGSMLAAEYMVTKKPAGVVSLIFSGPCLSASRWITDQHAWISQMPDSMQNAIRIGEETGNFATPEYQSALNYFYSIHVCRMNPWPDCLNRSLAKMGVDVYEYMWGPSEFTATGTLKNFDRTGEMTGIKVPTLFTCGEFDEATPATTAWYQSLLPGSELKVFQDASHEHHLEKESEYIAAVREFIGKQ